MKKSFFILLGFGPLLFSSYRIDKSISTDLTGEKAIIKPGEFTNELNQGGRKEVIPASKVNPLSENTRRWKNGTKQGGFVPGMKENDGSLTYFKNSSAADTLISNLNGNWEGVLNTPSGSAYLVYTFKVTGTNLTGFLDYSSGETTIIKGKVALPPGNTFSFMVKIGDFDYPHTGKFYADSCDLDIDFNGIKAHTTLFRFNK